MRVLFAIMLASLAGCGWFQHKPRTPDPPQLVVTGIAAGSVLFIDGVQDGQAQVAGNRTRILGVAPGDHMLEVKMDGSTVYRESTYVGPGDKRVLTVLSGAGRD